MEQLKAFIKQHAPPGLLLSPGVRYMLIATASFTIMQICVKSMKRFPAAELVFIRSIISFVITLVMLRMRNISPWGVNKKLLVLRGLFGVIALLFYFTALQNLPLAVAFTVHHLSPVFTVILGAIILKERVRLPTWIFFFISFLGVVVIKGFDFSGALSWFHLLLALGSAVFAAAAYNAVRRLRTTDHPLVVVFYFPLVSIPITLFFISGWVWPMGWLEWAMALGVGVFTQFGQYFLTKALQSDNLAAVSYLKYMGVVYSLFAGYFIFDETLGLYTILGVGLVMTGVVMNLSYNNRIKKRLSAEKEPEKQG